MEDTERLALILAACMAENITLSSIDEEVGERQCELALGFTPDIEQATLDLQRAKEIVQEVAHNTNASASFAAKPYDNQPGSGLHIHLSLHDEDGNNLFSKQRGEEDTELLLHAVGGLCDAILRDFIYFAPHEASYTRFTSRVNEVLDENTPLQKYNNAPINISWGGNNRTTAIRIPTSTLHPDSRHIEHRISGADAEPEAVIHAVIAAALHGVAHKITPPEKCFGNAFDAQYDYTRFPLSLAEAQRCHAQYGGSST